MFVFICCLFVCFLFLPTPILGSLNFYKFSQDHTPLSRPMYNSSILCFYWCGLIRPKITTHLPQNTYLQEDVVVDINLTLRRLVSIRNLFHNYLRESPTSLLVYSVVGGGRLIKITWGASPPPPPPPLPPTRHSVSLLSPLLLIHILSRA